MYAVSLGYEHIFSKLYLSEIELYMANRNDSGPGFYDTEDVRLSVLLRYSIDKSIDFDTRLEYRDYEYDNNVIIDPSDEGSPGKKGYSLRLKINKVLETDNVRSEFFSGLRYDDYDSNDSNYIYQRLQVFVGLRVKFENE